MAMSTLAFVRRISTSTVCRSSSLDAQIQKANMNTSILHHWKKELEYAKTQGPAGEKRWRNICLFVALPLLVLVNIKIVKEHMEHPHERPPFTNYEYQHIRTKKFPWKDGNKTLFYNPKVNALPEGYEDEM